MPRPDREWQRSARGDRVFDLRFRMDLVLLHTGRVVLEAFLSSCRRRDKRKARGCIRESAWCLGALRGTCQLATCVGAQSAFVLTQPLLEARGVHEIDDRRRVRRASGAASGTRIDDLGMMIHLVGDRCRDRRDLGELRHLAAVDFEHEVFAVDAPALAELLDLREAAGTRSTRWRLTV